MLERLLNALSALGHWGYAIIFLAPFLESSAFLGLIIPGESVVIIAGFLASHGFLEVGDCMIVIALGAILGDSTGYALGKAIGRDYFDRHERLFLFKKKHMQMVESYFARHGGKTVFWGRLVHLLRAMAPFAAGMSSMPYRQFIFYNAAGGTLWAVAFTLVGYFFGQSWQLIDKWIGRAGVFVVFLVLVIAGFAYLYKRLANNWAAISRWFQGIPSSHIVTRLSRQHPKVVAFIAQRLSASSYLGLHLTAGLTMSAIFVWVFGGITEDILTGDPFVQVDQWVVGRILYFRSPLATLMMESFTNLGGIKFIAAGSLAVVAYLVYRRSLYRVAGFATAIVGASLLNIILKTIIHRPRPLSDTTLIPAVGWSFPSGHAMSSVVFYGMIVYLLIQVAGHWRLKSFFIALAGFIVVIIGFSRIYLQVHYLSDVIAGFAGGLFWLSICVTGMEIYSQKKKLEIRYDQTTH